MSSPITPPLTPCTVTLRYCNGKILAKSSGITKEFRWACHLHGGTQVNKEWAIPTTKLYDFIGFCSSRGAGFEVGEGVAAFVWYRAGELAKRYQELEAHPFWDKLYPYQRSGAQFLSTYSHALLLDEMGLGKTIQALMALPKGATGLIVCPASLRLNWQIEGEKWRPDLRFEICKTPKRMHLTEAMLVMSPECLTALSSPDIFDQGKGCVVFDECHYYKNPKAKRSIAAAHVAKYAQTCWGLTGTAMANAPPDIRGVLRTFGLFNNAFATGEYFDRQFGMSRDHMTGFVTWPKKPEHAAEVARSISRVAMRRTRAEALPDLPKKSWAEIVVDISSDKVANLELPEEGETMQRVYRALDKEGVKAVPADWSVIGRVRAKVAAAKIPAMLTFIASFLESKTPLVVACFNRAPLQAMQDEGYHVIHGDVNATARHVAVTAFQDGDTDVIGIQLQAGGIGLNLQRASHMLMVQRDWSPSVNTQAEDRLVRIGQTNAVIIYDLLANHPLDQRISRAVRDKQTRIAATVGRVGDSILYGEGLIAQMKSLAAHIDNRAEQAHNITSPRVTA